MRLLRRSPYACAGAAVAAGLAVAIPNLAIAQSATEGSTSTDARMAVIEQQMKAMQQELERLKQDLNRKDEQLKESRNETRQLQEELKQSRDETQQLQGEVKQTRDETQQLQEQVKATTTKVEKVENEKPLVTFPNGRPTISSEDGRYSLAIGTQTQFDVGTYFQDSPGDVDPAGAHDLNSGENLRRGRLFVVGKIDDFTLNITPDFGGSPDGSVSLYEANLNYTGLKPVTATIGYFKPWLTLQDSMSSNDFLFLERPSIVEIARNVAAGDARASVGAKASGDDYFAAAYLTGGNWGSQQAALLNDEQTGATLRLATRPFRGEDWNTHIGASASMAFNFNDNDAAANDETVRLRDRPELRIDMNRLIDTGDIPADDAVTYGVELAANWRNFLLQGEYIRIDVDQDQPSGPSPSLSFQGGYVEGSWVITGEGRHYNASAAAYARPSPKQPFSLEKGGWGAWELAARYSIADLDSHEHKGEAAADTGGVFGGLQQVYSLALSWYPNDYIRFVLQFSHVDVDRRDAETGESQVGQDFQDIALRTQISF